MIGSCYNASSAFSDRADTNRIPDVERAAVVFKVAQVERVVVGFVTGLR